MIGSQASERQPGLRGADRQGVRQAERHLVGFGIILRRADLHGGAGGRAAWVGVLDNGHHGKRRFAAVERGGKLLRKLPAGVKVHQVIVRKLFALKL